MKCHGKAGIGLSLAIPLVAVCPSAGSSGGQIDIQAENYDDSSADGFTWWVVPTESEGFGEFSGATGENAEYIQVLTTSGEGNPSSNNANDPSPG